MSIDGREFRNALGRFTTGVCVITTVTGTGEALGLTANSFASVSLDPPLVLWSLQNDSDVYAAFSSPRYYAINVLAVEHLEHSNRYATKGEHLLAEAHYRPGKYGSPVFPDALASFECELHAVHQGGDHQIIVGRVRAMTSRPDGDPLLFYSGAYRELG